MRELQVDAAALDVEGRAEVLVRHRIAFAVPARTTVAPRARPRRLVALRFLPQGKVERVFLRALPGGRFDDDVRELLVRQDAERLLRLPRAEVHLPIDVLRHTQVSQTTPAGRGRLESPA